VYRTAGVMVQAEQPGRLQGNGSRHLPSGLAPAGR